MYFMVIIGQQESQFLKIKFKILWKLEIGKKKKKWSSRLKLPI